MSTQRLLSRLSATALALVIGALVLVGPLVRPASAGPVPSADTEFLSLLNTLRGTLGLSTLGVDSQASSVARTWSQNMASTGTLAHNPNLSTQISSWSKLGENVGTGGTVVGIFNALVASPPHMRNMSDGGFTMIGIGTVLDGSGRLWTTHVFLRPGSVAAPVQPAAPVTTRAPAPPTTRAAPKAASAPASAATAPAATAPAATAPAATAAAATTTPPATVPPTAVTPAPAPSSSMATLPVEVASSAAPTASAPPLAPVVPASSTSEQGPAPLLALAALVGLVGLSGAGFLAHRARTLR